MKISVPSLILLGFSSLFHLSTASEKKCKYNYGHAYDFSIGSCISIESKNNGTFWVPTQAFTYQFSIKPFVLTTERTQFIIGNLVYEDVRKYNSGLVLLDNELHFFIGNNFYDLTDKTNKISYDILEYESKWLHVTATYNGAEKTAKLYINGELVSENTSVSKGIITDDPIYIGALDTSLPLRALMDEIRMFNYTLTEEQIKNNWNKPLTRDDMYGVMFYFNADGDGYNKFIDKSGNGRDGSYSGFTVVDRLSPRSNFIANCKGCFDGSELSFCIPNENNSGYCGDGEMLGDKVCDGGDNCNDNCTCDEGYFGSGFGGCLPYADHCDWRETLTECEGTLDPTCSCECFKENGTQCMYRKGCYTDVAPYQLYRTWISCITLCINNRNVCYDGIVPEYCVRFTTPGECYANGCYWCGSGCTTFESSCIPSCGNSIIDDGEECDDGNEVDGDGCSKDCRLEEGFVCNTSVIPTLCASIGSSNGEWRWKDDEMGKGEIAGVVIGALAFVAILILGILMVIALWRRKEAERESYLISLGENNGFGFATEDEEEEEVFDESSGTKVENSVDFPLMLGDSSWSFDLKDGKRGEIGKVLVQKTTIANLSHKKVTWRIYNKKCEKYRIIAKPHEGRLSSGERKVISIELIMYCTTNVNEDIPICAWYGKRLDGHVEMVYMYVNAKASGKLSTRLDPDEVKLVQPPIGEGSFGTVFRGFYKGQEIAAKVLKNQAWGDKIQELYREIKIMDELRSPFIVNFVGAVTFPGRMCLVSEYVPQGSLNSNLRRHPEMEFIVRLRLVLDCAKGMEYLHSCKIMHRDLKTDNVLVVTLDETAPVCAKITDFGSTREIGDEISKNYTQGVGTPIYMAPEVLENDGYSKAADVYSFGILMHEVYTGKEPYSEFDFKKPWQISEHVISGGRMTIPEDCPSKYSRLMKKCWANDINDRPEFTTILHKLDDMFIPLIQAKHPEVKFESVKSKTESAVESLASVLPTKRGSSKPSSKNISDRNPSSSSNSNTKSSKGSKNNSKSSDKKDSGSRSKGSNDKGARNVVHITPSNSSGEKRKSKE